MHELSICQALISQVENIARENGAARVNAITLGIGPLSGVEERLLQHAYPVASAGSVAESAELRIQSLPLRVSCSACGQESDASTNRLVCGVCGNWRTELVSGDEMLLLRIEFEKPSAREVLQ